MYIKDFFAFWTLTVSFVWFKAHTDDSHQFPIQLYTSFAFFIFHQFLQKGWNEKKKIYLLYKKNKIVKSKTWKHIEDEHNDRIQLQAFFYPISWLQSSCNAFHAFDFPPFSPLSLSLIYYFLNRKKRLNIEMERDRGACK